MFVCLCVCVFVATQPMRVLDLFLMQIFEYILYSCRKFCCSFVCCYYHQYINISSNNVIVLAIIVRSKPATS